MCTFSRIFGVWSSLEGPFLAPDVLIPYFLAWYILKIVACLVFGLRERLPSQSLASCFNYLRGKKLDGVKDAHVGELFALMLFLLGAEVDMGHNRGV